MPRTTTPPTTPQVIDIGETTEADARRLRNNALAEGRTIILTADDEQQGNALDHAAGACWEALDGRLFTTLDDVSRHNKLIRDMPEAPARFSTSPAHLLALEIRRALETLRPWRQDREGRRACERLAELAMGLQDVDAIPAHLVMRGIDRRRWNRAEEAERQQIEARSYSAQEFAAHVNSRHDTDPHE